MSYLRKRLKAFSFAISGLMKACAEEAPFKVHLAATAVVCVLGFYFGVKPVEWCMLVICCGFVIAMELINTSIERLSDVVKKEQDPAIKFVKDAGAAAVLIAAVASVIAGVIIFYPYFRELLA